MRAELRIEIDPTQNPPLLSFDMKVQTMAWWERWLVRIGVIRFQTPLFDIKGPGVHADEMTFPLPPPQTKFGQN